MESQLCLSLIGRCTPHNRFSSRSSPMRWQVQGCPSVVSFPDLPQRQIYGHAIGIWRYHQTEGFLPRSQLLFRASWAWKCSTSAWCCLQPGRNISLTSREESLRAGITTITFAKRRLHRKLRQRGSEMKNSASLTGYRLKGKKLPGEILFAPLNTS